MKPGKRWRWAVLGLLGAASLTYAGVLLYAWNQYGVSPAEVNSFLYHRTLGKGGLKPSAPPAPAATRDGRWVQDLQYLKSELPRLHANAFHSVTRQDWEKAVDALAARVPDLPDAQLKVGVMELVALIGDGHTKLAWWRDRNFQRYPLGLGWFGPELRVTGTTGATPNILGAKLVGVGGQSVQEALQRARRVSSRESELDAVTSAQYHLLFPEVQTWLGLKAGEFEFVDRAGKPLNVKLTPVPWAEVEKAGGLMKLPALNISEEQPEKLFWFRKLNDHTVYLRYRSCDDQQGFAALTAQLLPALQEIPARRRALIVDMRDNGGGNSSYFDPLLAGLQKLKMGQGGGRVGVLVNRFTYSSALLNTVTLKTRFDARLYGEPSSEKLTSYGEVRTFDLPNSKLVIQYSTRLFRLAPELGDALLPPDVPVTQSFGQYLKGIDPVLDAAMQGL